MTTLAPISTIRLVEHSHDHDPVEAYRLLGHGPVAPPPRYHRQARRIAGVCVGEQGPLPDFVIIGAMKAGTTTLFHSLGTHPQVVIPSAKEPAFFAEESAWQRGLGWYTGLFPSKPPGCITGEASTRYLTPAAATISAQRMRATIPDARLICMVRDPEARLRSHYRHEVQRNREHRTLAEAVASPDSIYVAMSCYTTLLTSWLREFPRDQLLVLPLDDLTTEDRGGWKAVLDHLGLAHVDATGDHYNDTWSKAQFTPLMQRIYDSRWRDRLAGLPRPIRGALRPLLFHRGKGAGARYAESEAPLPSRVHDILAAENDRLRVLLQRTALPWEVDVTR